MFVMMYMYKKNFPCDMTDKEIKSAILKENRTCKTGEDIRASVELELSCELWVGGNVKWI